MLGAPTGTAEALKGAQALAGSPNVLGVVGPAGSNEIVGVTKSLKDGGLAWVIGFVHPHDAHDGRNAHGLHVPHRPAGRDPGPDGGELHPARS